MLEKTGLTGAAHWLEDNFARLVAEHDVPGATVAVLAEGRVTTATGGVHEPPDVGRGRRGLRVPDRLHHQGLDHDAGDAARRRRPARPRPAPARPTSPSSSSPTMDAAAAITTRQLLTHTGRLRGRHLHRHRPGRRRHREVRRTRWRSCRSSSRPASSSPTTTPPSSSSAASSRCCGASPRRGRSSSTSRTPLGLTHVAPEPVRGDPAPCRRRPRRPGRGRRDDPGADMGAGPVERARRARCSP